MSDPENDDHSTFFRMSLSDEEDGTPVQSRAAFQLHRFAIVNSARDGTSGCISDDYLNAIPAETTLTAAELCVLGLWERDNERGGYTINDPMVDEVVRFKQQMDEDKAFCEATGGHETSEESGSNLCTKCHAPLGPISGPDETDE